MVTPFDTTCVLSSNYYQKWRREVTSVYVHVGVEFCKGMGPYERDVWHTVRVENFVFQFLTDFIFKSFTDKINIDF
jgi:hypothetical protein